jgi:hypothetical protein
MSDPWLPHIATRDSNSPIAPTHDQVGDTRRPFSCSDISHLPQFTVLYVVRSPLTSPFYVYLRRMDR